MIVYLGYFLGLVGNFNDGTVVGCSRCDPTAGSVESIGDAANGLCRLDDGALLVDGRKVKATK